jgi:hypothetical protein
LRAAADDVHSEGARRGRFGCNGRRCAGGLMQKHYLLKITKV